MRIPNPAILARAGLAGGALVAGVYLIVPHEGEVRRTYLDPVGILTACFGHTGPELRPGQEFTEQQCLDMLAEDLSEHNQQLMSVVEVPLQPHQHAAFLSLHYNIGHGNFRASTLLDRLNKGETTTACAEIMRWHYAGKKDCYDRDNNCYGIIERRYKEHAMCVGAIPIDLETP